MIAESRAVERRPIVPPGPKSRAPRPAWSADLAVFENDRPVSDVRVAEDTDGSVRLILLADLGKIPGIGTALAAAIPGVIRGIRRFRNGSARVAYVGIDPAVFPTGEFRPRARPCGCLPRRPIITPGRP